MNVRVSLMGLIALVIGAAGSACSSEAPAPSGDQATVASKSLALGTETAVWEHMAGPPTWGLYGAMAYDSARGRAVYFGGGNSSTGYNARTWEWFGGKWNLASSSGSARAYPMLAYDSARQRTVMYGGFGDSGYLGDTWEWDGATWTQRSTTGPGGRYYGSMAYDSLRQRTVLFGGYGPNDLTTWEWDGTTWTPRADGPAWRAGSGMAFDSVRGKLVLFGGVDDVGDVQSSTWEWNGSSWTVVPVGSPPPARALGQLVFDSVRGKTVLFAGNGGSGYLNDVWDWDGATWTERCTAAACMTTRPVAQYEHVMVFDAARGKTFLYGGNNNYMFFPNTWEWDGTSWTTVGNVNPAARLSHGMVFDTSRSRTVLWGGLRYDNPNSNTYLTDTWEWDGALWSLRATTGPPARGNFAYAFDSVRNRFIIHGGYNPSLPQQAQSDTWEWNGTSWTNACTGACFGTGPNFMYSAAMAYDSARQVSVFFGGTFPTNNRTWEWNGTAWSERCTTSPCNTTLPTPRSSHKMAYDATRQRIVMYGGKTDAGTRLGDTWEYSGTSWALRATTGPAPREASAMTYDPTRSRVVLFGGFTNSGTAQDTWEWDGTAWSQTGTNSTPVRHSHAMAFDIPRKRAVVFGGLTDFNETFEYHVRGGTCSVGSTCDTGFCVDGTCCEQSVCGTCEACNLSATPGLCADVINGTDDTCNGSNSCGPTGACGLPNGSTCTSASQCASTFCADGKCCNTACSGACDACNGADRGWASATNGVCRTAPAGFAGEPTCSPYVCNGSSSTCASPCTGDADCASAFYCAANGICTARKSTAGTCDATADCKVSGCRVCAGTSECKDGVCCSSACTSACQTCSATPGTCTSVKSGDDADTCSGQNTCDAQGACKLKNGQSCGAATECASGFCSDGVCCNASCNGGCDVCAASLGASSDGVCTIVPAGSAGSTPSCSPYLCAGGAACPASCTSDAGCAAGFYCSAAGSCQARKAQGQACNLAAGSDCFTGGCRACQSSNCVDGFCCNSACSSSCDVCAASLGATVNGTCSLATEGYAGSPACGAYACNGLATTCAGNCTSDLHCGAGYYCNKSGQCVAQKTQGQTCDTTAGVDCLVTGCRACASGSCADGYCCNSACSGSCDVCAASLGALQNGTCGNALAGSAGSPSCAPYLCTGTSASCGTSCTTDAQCATSAYCASGSCKADEPNGVACASNAACQSGFCVDGVCCNSACNGTCQACTALLKGTGSDGACGNAENGRDPHDDCTADPASTCQLDGQCNGAGGCRLYPQTTPCGSTTCDGSRVTGQICDGAGQCVPATGGVECAPYICAGTGCTQPCASNADCIANYYCDPSIASGTCRQKLPLGSPCSSDNACASTFCVDGVCCDARCSGVCKACRAADKASGLDDGVCGDAADGKDPHDDCADSGAATCLSDGSCGGNGACRNYASGTTCKASDCANNAPTSYACNGLGACLSTAAAGCGSFACVAAACKSSCTVDTDCATGAFCAAGVCQAQSPKGTTCASGAECASTFCVDGYCCDQACSGLCEACDIAQAEGTCAAVTGAPHGGRGDCPAATADNPCAPTSCDGNERTTCVAFAGASVECRAASCSSGTATLRASCNGTGSCPAATTQSCEPYTCDSVAGVCKTTCTVDTDCADKFHCAAPTGSTTKQCVPAVNVCQTDGHTVSHVDGTTEDCAPYLCDASGTCRTNCASTQDCVSPTVCLNEACVSSEEPSGGSATPEDDSGCGCRTARSNAPAWPAFVLLLIAVRRRRNLRDTRASAGEHSRD
jgi:hypothetical protein